MISFRNLFRWIAIVGFATLFTMCKKEGTEPEEGKGSFSLSFNEVANALKSDIAVTDIYVSIETASGEEVLNMHKLPLLRLGTGYVTESIQLESGRYAVTAFMVASGSEIIYLTPREGSEKAHLVNNPLPIEFSVSPERTTSVVPEVVRVTDCSCPPEEFGYVNFSFTIVDETTNWDLSGTWYGCFYHPFLEYFREPCEYIEIFQEGNFVMIETTAGPLEGTISGNTLSIEGFLYDSLVLLELDIHSNDYMDNVESACRTCLIVSMERQDPSPVDSCYNFDIMIPVSSYIIILGNGIEPIVQGPIEPGLNSFYFENTFDHYIVQVESDSRLCPYPIEFYIGGAELNDYSCAADRAYPIYPCEFPLHDTILPPGLIISH